MRYILVSLAQMNRREGRVDAERLIRRLSVVGAKQPGNADKWLRLRLCQGQWECWVSLLCFGGRASFSVFVLG